MVVSAGGSAYFDRVVEHLGTGPGRTTCDSCCAAVATSPTTTVDTTTTHPSTGGARRVRHSASSPHSRRGSASCLDPSRSSRDPRDRQEGRALRRNHADSAGRLPGRTTSSASRRSRDRRESDGSAAFVRLPSSLGLEPGDVVSLGVAHPCTAFDKHRLVSLSTTTSPCARGWSPSSRRARRASGSARRVRPVAALSLAWNAPSPSRFVARWRRWLTLIRGATWIATSPVTGILLHF